MSRVFWDTNLFIYLIEDAGEVSERVVALRRRMLARGDELFTSALTLGEVLVKPVEAKRDDLVHQYEDLLTRAVTIVPFDIEAARRYAAIRVDRTVRAPDAMQLACAARVNTDLFITNDGRLSATIVPGIQFITSLARAFV